MICLSFIFLIGVSVWEPRIKIKVGAQASDGVYNARELIRCFKEPEQGKPCPVICRGRECEKLGG